MQVMVKLLINLTCIMFKSWQYFYRYYIYFPKVNIFVFDDDIVLVLVTRPVLSPH